MTKPKQTLYLVTVSFVISATSKEAAQHFVETGPAKNMCKPPYLPKVKEVAEVEK